MRNRKIIALGLACTMAAPAMFIATSAFLAVDALHSPAAAQGIGGGPGAGGGGSSNSAGGASAGATASIDAGTTGIERGTTASIARAENANSRASFGLERASLGLSVSSVASDRNTTGKEKADAIREILEEATCGSC